MICPKCEAEYIEGITKCADCGADLIPKDDFEGNLVHPSDYAIVYTCSEDYEAEMLKANLQSAGIEVLILGQKDRNYPGVGGLAVIKILVKKSEAAEARTIIDDINSRESEEESED